MQLINNLMQNRKTTNVSKNNKYLLIKKKVEKSCN